MAKEPGIGYRIKATIVGVKGTCHAGHHEGEAFKISCHDPGGLCSFFYHSIFPTLSTFLVEVTPGGKETRSRFSVPTFKISSP